MSYDDIRYNRKDEDDLMLFSGWSWLLLLVGAIAFVLAIIFLF